MHVLISSNWSVWHANEPPKHGLPPPLSPTAAILPVKRANLCCAGLAKNRGVYMWDYGCQTVVQTLKYYLLIVLRCVARVNNSARWISACCYESGSIPLARIQGLAVPCPLMHVSRIFRFVCSVVQSVQWSCVIGADKLQRTGWPTVSKLLSSSWNMSKRAFVSTAVAKSVM